MTRPEQDLIEALRAGELAAFQLVYRRHHQALLRVARRIVGHRADAEDAIQDAFVILFRRVGEFRGESALENWMHRVVVNLCLKLLVKRAARAEESGRTAELHAVIGDGARGDGEEAAALEREIEALPLRQKLVFTLAEVEGFSFAEIAEILRLHQPTVRFHLCKARERLRARLAPLLEMRTRGGR